MIELGEIHQSNAPLLIGFLASELWHDIAPGEWNGLLSRLESSNAADGVWVELQLGEGPILSLSLARMHNPGRRSVVVRATASDSLLSQIRFIVLFLNRYIVRAEA